MLLSRLSGVRWRLGAPMAALLAVSLVLLLAGCGGGGGVGNVSIPNIDSSGSTASGGSTSGGTTSGGTSGTSLSAQAPPSLPSIPPQIAQASRAGHAPQKGSPGTQPQITMTLPAGWNVISFPFASVATVTGLKYELYAYGAAGFTLVDPVNQPQSVDTRLAYLAYCDATTTVTATGTDNSAGTVTSASLNAGWNLVGCPSSQNLLWSNLSFTTNGVTRVIEEASNAMLSSNDAWLCQNGFTLWGTTATVTDLQAAGSALPSQQGCWVFAWQDVQLNFNVVAPSPVPVITAVAPTAVKAGDTLTVTGTGFPTTGTLNLGGVPVPAGNVASWSATQIVLAVPTSVATGNVVVYTGQYPSNRVSCTVTGTTPSGGSTAGGSSSGTGTVSGTVQGADASPLANCSIELDTLQSTTTDASGAFSLANVPAGDHDLIAWLADGSQWTHTAVVVTAGQTATLELTMTASSSSTSGGSVTGNGVVAGTVSSTGGGTLSGITVYVDSGQSAVSDASGAFSVANVSAGPHTIVASTPNYWPAVVSVTVTAGQTATAALNLQPYGSGGTSGGTTGGTSATTGTVSGTVTSATGAALSGGQVMLDTGQTAVTDASGAYSIANVTPGDHIVYVTLLGYQTGITEVTVVVGQTAALPVTLTAY